MKQLLAVLGIVIILAGGYALYMKRSLTADDEYLPTQNKALPPDYSFHPIEPAGKPGPPADTNKMFAWLSNWYWNNATDKTVYIMGTFGVVNENIRPVHNIVVELSVTYENAPSLNKKFTIDLSKVDGAMGSSTQGVLFPNRQTDIQQFSYPLPVDNWRRDTYVTLSVIEAEIFDDRSNLEEPMQLHAFIYESTTAKIKEAFAANPKLKEVKSTKGRGPLQFALMQPVLDKVKLMESSGFDLNKPAGWNESAYHFAVFGGPKIIDYLHSRGVKSTVATFDDLTPAHIAVRQWDVTVIPALKRAGISLDGQTKEGKTALHIAAELLDLDLIGALLKAGARQNIFNKYNQGFMGTLVYARRTDLMDQAVKAGATINEVAPDGTTLLHHAVRSSSMDVTRWLMERGANPNAKNKAGESPLDLLARHITHPVDREMMKEILTTVKKKK